MLLSKSINYSLSFSRQQRLLIIERKDMSTTQEVASDLRFIASESCDYQNELLVLAEKLDPTHYAKGTIVKAIKGQDRFKNSSIWVSLGNGKYQHLTGKKNLIAKHLRLDGYVNPVWVN